MTGDAYNAAVEYEYLCETYDRSLRGAFNERGEYMPFNIVDASSHALRQAGIIRKKHDVKFSEIVRIRNNPRFDDYQWLTKEYNRLFPKQTQISLSLTPPTDNRKGRL